MWSPPHFLKLCYCLHLVSKNDKTLSLFFHPLFKYILENIVYCEKNVMSFKHPFCCYKRYCLFHPAFYRYNKASCVTKIDNGVILMGTMGSFPGDTVGKEPVCQSGIGGLVSQSCPTPCDPLDCHLPVSSVSGKNTGVGCHFLLQGIFLTQALNLGLLHCRQILYQLSYKGSLPKRDRG